MNRVSWSSLAAKVAQKTIQVATEAPRGVLEIRTVSEAVAVYGTRRRSQGPDAEYLALELEFVRRKLRVLELTELASAILHIPSVASGDICGAYVVLVQDPQYPEGSLELADQVGRLAWQAAEYMECSWDGQMYDDSVFDAIEARTSPEHGAVQGRHAERRRTRSSPPAHDSVAEALDRLRETRRQLHLMV